MLQARLGNRITNNKSDMTKIIPILLVSLFFPLSTAFAIGDFDPGGQYNPIHVEVEPTAQYRNQNLEASLKAQHGSSAFYSCMNKVSACSGDQSDPSRRYACLQNIEYAFQTPLCRAQQPVQCQAGYTLVNGSCVRQQVTPTACPSGYMFIGTGCAPFTCSAGYVPQGNQCVRAQQNPAPTQPTTQQPVWNNTTAIDQIIQQVGAASGSAGGGSAGGGSGPALESCVRKVLSQDTNFGMLSPDECYATWQAAVEVAITNYESPKMATVAENKEQVASAALADWQAPAVDESKQEPRRGFWSWLLSLFGF